MSGKVGVIGAGIVGITTALELADRGYEVLLLDRGEPGRQTSYGNAGVISASTVLAVNNPDLWRQLPTLLRNRSSYFRYDPAYALSQWRWLLAFFARARGSVTGPTAKALRELLHRSWKKHLSLIARASASELLLENGWLKLYRSEDSFAASERERRLLTEFAIPYSILSPDEIATTEPLLRRDYARGMLLPECCSIRSPGKLAQAYHHLYEASGGVTLQQEVTGIRRGANDAPEIELKGTGPVRVDQLVIAAGPWSPEVCRMTGHRIPMAWERGYHLHLEAPAPGLNRPVFDADLGVVISPQESSLRVTTGVEFVHRDAPPNYSLIRAAVESARRVAIFGDEIDETPWLGSRPSLPDSLPMIGRSPRRAGLWFNFGHQHIGLAASAASAELLADLMEGKQHASIDARPFEPARFRT